MKPVFDFTFSLVILIILSPIILFLCIIVFIDVGRPIFFIQKRPGLNNHPFNFYKSRTMLNKKDDIGTLLEDNKRITKIGSFLRKTSLDELPSFINVLKGEMSIVGPRPLLMEYLALYTEEQSKRHSVKPGITGWAQINGRNAISWEEKFDFDIWYIDNKSFWIDIKILFLTLIKVLKRDGI
jgi:sugar transferase EpsL